MPLFVSSGGFQLSNMDFNKIEMIYSHLINSFLNSYSANEIINYVNVSFHTYNSIIILKELISKIGL